MSGIPEHKHKERSSLQLLLHLSHDSWLARELLLWYGGRLRDIQSQEQVQEPHLKCCSHMNGSVSV